MASLRQALELIDIQHVADEIASVSSFYQFEMAGRCSELLSLLARWQRQKGQRCELWRRLIDLHRDSIEHMLVCMPSLRKNISDRAFLDGVWIDTRIKVIGENGCYDLFVCAPN